MPKKADNICRTGTDSNVASFFFFLSFTNVSIRTFASLVKKIKTTDKKVIIVNADRDFFRQFVIAVVSGYQG